jgi:hypothetical protein
MEKVIRNGLVAVLISRGYGAGWYTWNSDHKQLLFHPKIVKIVEDGKRSLITEEWLKEEGIISNEDYVYCGGAESLQIEWLLQGTAFDVEEYDGAESLKTISDLVIVA